MKRILFIVAIFFLLPASAFTSQRYALVIGNGAYESAPLSNPANDAEDMAVTLKKLGFQVDKRINADQRAMETAIDAFGQKLRAGGVGLFYYAGHGMQAKGQNYLIPVNSRIKSESDIKYKAVNAGLVLGKMEDAGNRLNIVILDACRDNPFKRSFRSGSRGLVLMDAPAGVIVAYATAPGSVAADGSGRNGVYTKHLLRHMVTPGLTIEKVLKNVRIDVAKETGRQQMTWDNSSLMGDFYFARGDGATAQPTYIQSVQPVQTFPVEPSGPQIVKTDGVYVAYANGIVFDKNTDLEWYAGPDKGMDWNEAAAWVRKLSINGGGWRMPTLEELKTLYQKGKGSRNMTPLLETSSWYVWASGYRDKYSRYRFYFRKGRETWGNNPSPFSKGRAFAVRFRG